MPQHNKKSGFTLVELAIVLVIIGLIIGGVLVGQDLINAAKLKNTVSQVQSYDAAVNTFQAKYNGLPGDLQSQRAASFGFTARNGAAGRGDGNGIVESGAATAVSNVLGFETGLFWRDLSTAALIADGFSTATDAAAASLLTNAAFKDYVPETKLHENTVILITNSAGRNYYYISAPSATAAGGAVTYADGLSTSEAKSIDEKLDDGLPATGQTIATTAMGATNPTADGGAAAATGICVNSTPTPDDYNVGPQFANEINCQLAVRASF